uniref:Uncharacterized protein n=1 Tax=Rhizophora mucronata TaxID=61149 RepID=A0A2P2KKK9_RHIMU
MLNIDLRPLLSYLSSTNAFIKPSFLSEKEKNLLQQLTENLI